MHVRLPRVRVELDQVNARIGQRRHVVAVPQSHDPPARLFWGRISRSRLLAGPKTLRAPVAAAGGGIRLALAEELIDDLVGTFGPALPAGIDSGRVHRPSFAMSFPGPTRFAFRAKR